jgi:ubiquinone/menaquinone biosynthesis C-methylase UbiE
MTKSKVQYWSQSSQSYDTSVDKALGGNIRPLINEKLQKENYLGKVVEFECGTGYFTKTLASKSESVIATDFSDDMLAVAQQQLDGWDNVTFQNEDWQHTTFADETFDTIFAGFIVPCVEDKPQAIRESYRILKSHGTLIVANPNILLLKRFNLFRFLLRSLIAWRINLPPVSFRSVKDLLEHTGFTVVSMDVIQDPTDKSSAPVEYVKLVKS